MLLTYTEAAQTTPSSKTSKEELDLLFLPCPFALRDVSCLRRTSHAVPPHQYPYFQHPYISIGLLLYH